jgi:tetratricopeptide (TPR) repeat protein
VTLYELLTLQPAFESTDRQELLRQIADEEPRSPRRLRASIPRELETIILKAMSKEAESRYATAQQLADDLRRFVEDKPIEARRPRLVERIAKWARRHRMLVGMSSLFLLLAVVTLATSTALIARQQREVVRQRDRARKAVDEMYTEVAQKWLAQEPQLEPLQREFLQKALAFYQGFAQERGSDPDAQRGAARAEANAADILKTLGERSRAEGGYRRAVEIQETLVAQLPKAPEYREDLANSYSRLTILLHDTGRLAEAGRTISRCLELFEGLVAEFPNDPLYRRNVANTYNLQAYRLREGGRFVEAERSVRRAIELLEVRVTDFP